MAPAANMVGTSQFFISCMKWQHAVILEPISETDSINILFPAQRTALLTPILTCFTLLSFSLLLGQFISSPTPFLLFFRDRIILSPISLPYSLPGLKILSPIPNSQKYSKSNFLSDVEKISPLCSPISYSCRWSLNSVH